MPRYSGIGPDRMRNEHHIVLATGDFVEAHFSAAMGRIDACESFYVQAHLAPWFVRATGMLRMLAVNTTAPEPDGHRPPVHPVVPGNVSRGATTRGLTHSYKTLLHGAPRPHQVAVGAPSDPTDAIFAVRADFEHCPALSVVDAETSLLDSSERSLGAPMCRVHDA